MAQDNSLKQSKSTDFSLRLFKHETIDVSKNVLVSPFSAYEVLSLAANGAVGRTRTQMAQALGFSADDLKSFNDRNHTVLQSLNNNKDVRMEIANALFADLQSPFKPSFVELCQAVYAAESRSENFADRATVGKINSWCEEKTHGKIKEIISHLTPAQKLVLINCVYFKGAWADPFTAGSTRPHDFKLLNGSVTSVPMMQKSGYFEYFASPGDGPQVLAIPYQGKHQVMYIFLPKVGAEYPAFLASFTPDNWTAWTNNFKSTEVDLSMPKYTMSFGTELNKTLKAMGMTDAFSSVANFGEMFAGRPVAISQVVQKTYMDVNENGTEAAAVTAVMMRSMAMRVPVASIPFVVDHPFVVALVDRDTNEILFLGSVVDPALK